jgi:murein L,D-transpeptidase YafK
MICTMVVRALVLTTALAAALTPVWCFGEDVNPLPAKAIKELPRELLSLIKQKKMTKYSTILVRVFKEEAELEVWKEDATGRSTFSKSFRSVGGRATLDRRSMRATARLLKGSIRSRLS